MESVIAVLLWFGLVSAGLMAGVYFAFSVFIMRALDVLEAPAGMRAMQSINRVILRSAFLPLFFASSAACAALAVIGALGWGAPGAWQAAAGGALYVIGMLLVTIAGNVPLNDRLETTGADGPEGAAMWRLYMRRWTAWNHLRTAACTVSLVLFAWALMARA